MLYIIPAGLGDDAQTAFVQRVADTMTKAGGQIVTHQVWQSRTLAYPIKKARQGVYVVAEFDLETENLKAFEREMRLMPDIIRFMIVRKVKKTAEQIEEEKRFREKINERKVHKAHVAAAAAQEKEKKKIEETAATQPAAETPKVSLEELDKKLDELLSDDNIDT